MIDTLRNERYYEHRSRTHGYDGRSFSLDKKEQAISNSSSRRQGYDNILYKYTDDIPLFGEEGFSDALEDDQVYSYQKLLEDKINKCIQKAKANCQ